MALTDRQIRTAKPGPKAQRFTDGGGLYLEVSPAGGRLWRWKYRFGGKEKRLSFGVYPDVSLAQAREHRDTARHQLARGIDPAIVKRAQKTAKAGTDALETVAREWHEKQAPTWAASHATTVLRRLELNVFPWLGTKPIGSIEAPALLDVLRRIESRGTIETAHRVRGVCDQLWGYAIATGRATRNVATDLKGALAPVTSEHYPAVTDPAELGGLLRMMDGYEGTLPVRVALLLQALLFVRPGELRHMKWSDVDLDAGQWCFVASKTNTPHIVPLATQAVALLKELQPLTGTGSYVFPSTRSASRPMSENTVNAALRRMGIDTRTMHTGHGFRATARTILAERLRMTPEHIEHQLAHVAVRGSLGAAYNRTQHLEERTRMMQAWADYLDGLRAPNVVHGDFGKARA